MTATQLSFSYSGGPNIDGPIRMNHNTHEEVWSPTLHINHMVHTLVIPPSGTINSYRNPPLRELIYYMVSRDWQTGAERYSRAVV